MYKYTILVRDHRLFAVIYHKWIYVMLIQGKRAFFVINYEIISNQIYR